MKHLMTTKLAIASAALTLLLAGCGQNGYQVDPYGNPYDPYGTGGYNDPYGSGTGIGGGYGSDYGSGSGSYGSDYGSGSGSYGSGGSSYGSGYGSDYGSSYGSGSYGGTTQYNGGELTAKVLDTKKDGFLFWKKVTATIQIKNATPGILTGDVTISFTKGGKVVDTQTEFVSDLGPNQTHTFDKKARKASDGVEVSVVTKAPSVVSTPSYGSGYGSGSSYGGSTGTGTGYSDPYGSSYGGSTGSTYGGSTGTGTGSGYGY